MYQSCSLHVVLQLYFWLLLAYPDLYVLVSFAQRTVQETNSSQASSRLSLQAGTPEGPATVNSIPCGRPYTLNSAAMTFSCGTIRMQSAVVSFGADCRLTTNAAPRLKSIRANTTNTAQDCSKRARGGVCRALPAAPTPTRTSWPRLARHWTPKRWHRTHPRMPAAAAPMWQRTILQQPRGDKCLRAEATM